MSPNLSDPEVRNQLIKDFHSNLTIYYILQRVAEREGRTDENTPTELRNAGTAIANYEAAIAPALNQALKSSSMVFYEDELALARDSPTPYVDVAINRFESDMANMRRWLADSENAHVVLNAENFASMMVVFSLWSQDDINQLVSAIQSGHITFRKAEGAWDPTENVVTTLQQFNVTNAFGTTFTALREGATFGELSTWMRENPLVIRGGATAPVPVTGGATVEVETTESTVTEPAPPAPEPMVETGAVTELSLGVQSERVISLKELLNAFMNYYGDDRLDTSSNVFDARTEESVKRMQEILRVEQTGKFDKATEDALNAFLRDNPNALGTF